MDFAPSARAADLTARVAEFMAAEIAPVEDEVPRCGSEPGEDEQDQDGPPSFSGVGVHGLVPADR